MRILYHGTGIYLKEWGIFSGALFPVLFLLGE